MTFDDFKRHFEIFSQIDSAEKLAICEIQYQNHLLEIEDTKYFEPDRDDVKIKQVQNYEKNLYKIFGLDTIEENKIYFLIRPSFEPEHLLLLEKLPEKFALTHTTLIKSYWTTFYADNSNMDCERKVSKTVLNSAVGDSLFKLLEKTIMDARPPKVKKLVLDGVVYMLLKLSDGERKIVSKHSPDENSGSGQVIRIAKQLIDNIERLDDPAILSNLQVAMVKLQGK